MKENIKDKKPIEYVLKEEEIQWQKGAILNIAYDAYREVDIKYTGCLNDRKTLEFRIGNLGLMARLLQKITKKEAGISQLVKLGEFCQLGSITATGENFGLTPLELIAKNDETDYIVKVKFTLPKRKP